MSRLTEKDKSGIVIMIKPREANNKLAELEDVLEEFGIESAEELRIQLNILDDELTDFKYRNQVLETENKKLSSETFRENFDNISKVWEFIKDNQTNGQYSDEICISKNKLHKFLNQVANGKLDNGIMEEIKELKSQLSKAIVPEFENGEEVYGIIDTMAYRDVFPVKIVGTNLVYEVDDGYTGTTMQHSSRMFKTEAEAQAKLDEIRRK